MKAAKTSLPLTISRFSEQQSLYFYFNPRKSTHFKSRFLSWQSHFEGCTTIQYLYHDSHGADGQEIFSVSIIHSSAQKIRISWLLNTRIARFFVISKYLLPILYTTKKSLHVNFLYFGMKLQTSIYMLIVDVDWTIVTKVTQRLKIKRQYFWFHNLPGKNILWKVLGILARLSNKDIPLILKWRCFLWRLLRFVWWYLMLLNELVCTMHAPSNVVTAEFYKRLLFYRFQLNTSMRLFLYLPG